MIIKRTTLTIMLLASIFCVAYAQSQNYRQQQQNMPQSSGELRFEQARNYIRNDSLFVEFELVVRNRLIAAGEALHIVPVYRVQTKELRLPEILINGKKREPYYRREQALLSHQDYWEQKPYAVLTLQKRGGEQHLRYHVSEPIPADMLSQGELNIEQLLEDCCDLYLVGTQAAPIESASAESAPRVAQTPAQPVITPPVYESSVTFIRPQKEVVKERNEHMTLRINYIVNRYDVLPHYANNAHELQKVNRVLRPLASRRETYKIQRASIKGYASPEAPYDYNLKLSQRRADGFKQYLMNEYGLYNLTQFPATGMGEDWDGLRSAVAQSNMAYRNQVLAIIDGVGIFNGREKMLMELAGGEPYRYMLRVLFPPLRRMEMEISYTVRSFELVEAEEIIEERPQDLSQEEIFEVARKRNNAQRAQTDRQGYGREYDVAAKYFPDDAVANINAASAALVRGDLDEAWRYLSKVENDQRAYNNLGVFYWLRGDTDRAAAYFNRAKRVKGEEARAEYNLKLLLQQVSQQKGQDASAQ